MEFYNKDQMNFNWELFYSSQYYLGKIYNSKGKAVSCEMYRSMLPQMIVKTWNSILFAEEPEVKFNDGVKESELVNIPLRQITTDLLRFGSIILVNTIVENELVVDVLYTNRSDVKYRTLNGKLVYLKYKKKIKNNTYVEYTHKIKNGRYSIYSDKGSKRLFNTNDLNLFPKMFNLDLFSSFGEPIYSSCVNNIMKIDVILNDKEYDRKESLPIIGYPSHLINKQANKKGNIDDYSSNLFVDTQRFRIVPTKNTSEQLPIEFRGNYKPSNYKEDINLELIFVSYGCGFGGKYFTFDPEKGIRTATEVVSDKDDVYKNKMLIDKILEEIIYYVNYFYVSEISDKGRKIEKEELIFKFSDSIITDDKAKRDQYYKDMIAGILPRNVYLELMGYSQETIDKVQEEDVQIVGE